MPTNKALRILIVDDDFDTAKTSCALLSMYGYECDICVEPMDCMAQVESLRPDVLLLDLSMPRMNGYDIAYELHNNPDLRPQLLIAVTGYNDPEDRERTKTAGFDYHLCKPTKREELVAILATVTPRERPLIEAVTP